MNKIYVIVINFTPFTNFKNTPITDYTCKYGTMNKQCNFRLAIINKNNFIVNTPSV